MGFLSKMMGTNSDYQYQADPNASAQYIANQQATAQKQNELLMALQGQAAGNGPNPAQDMLNQTTQQNNAQGASLIASQKGINPAIASRIAAQNTAQSNQMAAGQGATLGAQQQIAAQNGQMNLLGQEQQANLGQTQMAYNNVNAANQVNAGIASNNASNNANMFGSVVGGAGAAIGALAHGGEVPSKVHGFLEEMLGGKSDVGTKLKSGGQVPGTPKVPVNSYANDTVNAKLTPGENVIDIETMKEPGPVGDAARFVSAMIKKRNELKHA